MQKPQKTGSSYLPTLDGWRAIAILSVLFHHDVVHRLGPLSTIWLYDHGRIGVQVFFAISGILICSRLLDEETIDGTIHLGRFYVRRCFRILPPAMLYLGFLALLAGLSVIRVNPSAWWASVFFYRNYLPGYALDTGPYFTEHFWSLSLEEQFYFILPGLLVLTPKRYRLVVMGVLAILVRSSHAIILFLSRWVHFSFDHIVLNPLLIPAMFAVAASSPEARLFFKKALRIWPLLAFLTIGVITFGSTGIVGLFEFNAIDIVMPCIVLGSILNPDNIFGYVLEWAPLRYIGRISFSLYLWQQLFLVGHFNAENHSLGILQGWPWRLVMCFTCAFLSYHFLERPLARLGHKLAPSGTPGREDLTPPDGVETTGTAALTA